MRSAVAGRPKLSDVSSNPTSLLEYPLLVVCVADIIGTFVSTASPLSSSAIDLIYMYELTFAAPLNLLDAQIFR
jgi:hypothetical protein